MTLKSNFETKIPTGDNRERLVCRDCGHVVYENPKIVVGAIITHMDKVLLVKRNIEPRRHYWSFPGGFLEVGEAPKVGAQREAYEEACCEINISDLLAIYHLTRISQVQLIYKATLVGESFDVGEESCDARLFSWLEIPWGELAFPTVTWALKHHMQSQSNESCMPFENPSDESGDMDGA